MSRQIPFADLKSQYNAYKSEIDKAVLDVMGSSMYIMGPEVEKLEKNLAAYVGAKHALSVSSGTDALRVSTVSISFLHFLSATEKACPDRFLFEI